MFLKRRLLHVRGESAARGADGHFHMVSPVEKDFACSENTPHAVVIGSDGSVSPCVMKQIPVEGENYYYVRGQKHLQQNLSFSNIHQESLNTIWHRKEYQQFIQKILTTEASIACQNCLKGHIDNLI
jgi:hypothetical protein